MDGNYNQSTSPRRLVNLPLYYWFNKDLGLIGPVEQTKVFTLMPAWSWQKETLCPSSQIPSLYLHVHVAGPNFMALLTVSTESALTEAGYFVLTGSVFHRLVANFGFCACVLHVTWHSTLTRLAKEIRRLHVSGESWSETQNLALSRAMKLGPGLYL